MMLYRLLLPCLLFLATAVKADIVVFDDENNRLVLKQPAQRIISLAPHITELLYAAGAGDKVVAAVSYSDYPPAAKKLPRVGGYMKINIEAILLHKPDLVVAWGNSGATRIQEEKLKTLGFPVYINNPRLISDIPATLQRLGRLAHTGKIANRASADFMRQYQQLEKQYRHKKILTVFYQVWDTPLMTISGSHFISDAIRLCGGKNIFQNLSALAVKISRESVISNKPQIIIAGGMQGERVNWLDPWRAWRQIPAVKNGQLYSIAPELLQRHSPRILLGAKKLCTVIDKARTVYP